MSQLPSLPLDPILLLYLDRRLLALHAFLFRLAITVAVPIGEGTQKQWGNTFFTPPLTRFLVFLSSPPLSNFLTVFLWHMFGPKDPL